MSKLRFVSPKPQTILKNLIEEENYSLIVVKNKQSGNANL